MLHPLQNKSSKLGCKCYRPKELFGKCVDCSYSVYDHKNRVIQNNLNCICNFKNRRTEQISEVLINLNWTIPYIAEHLGRVFGIEEPDEVFGMHVDMLQHFKSPFNLPRSYLNSIRLIDLDIDFRSDGLCILYSIGNKASEDTLTLFTCIICLPCVCLCFQQMLFDVVDDIIEAASCTCMCCCSNGDKEKKKKKTLIIEECETSQSLLEKS